MWSAHVAIAWSGTHVTNEHLTKSCSYDVTEQHSRGHRSREPNTHNRTTCQAQHEQKQIEHVTIPNKHGGGDSSVLLWRWWVVGMSGVAICGAMHKIQDGQLADRLITVSDRERGRDREAKMAQRERTQRLAAILIRDYTLGAPLVTYRRPSVPFDERRTWPSPR